MMEQPIEIANEKEEEIPHVECPRCGTDNVLVKPHNPGIRMLNGVVYELYMTVCRQCGLLFTDTSVEVRE